MSSVFIDKLMHWRAGNWVKYEHGISNAVLRIHCDQLIITSDNKILESFNMFGKIKGFYKDDVLILVVSASASEIRKVKLRVQSNMEECLEVLGRYFPIVCHGVQNTNIITSKYRNINEVMKCAVEAMSKGDESFKLPQDYTNFVKLCLLDPAFPQFVRKTQNILDNVLKQF